MKTKKVTLTELSEILGITRQGTNQALQRGKTFDGLVIKVERLNTGKIPMKLITIKDQ